MAPGVGGARHKLLEWGREQHVAELVSEGSYDSECVCVPVTEARPWRRSDGFLSLQSSAAIHFQFCLVRLLLGSLSDCVVWLSGVHDCIASMHMKGLACNFRLKHDNMHYAQASVSDCLTYACAGGCCSAWRLHAVISELCQIFIGLCYTQ